jgi:hypothetical protein
LTPDPIAVLTLDVRHRAKKLAARLFAPQQELDSPNWFCVFEIDDPIGITRKIYGESSFQALLLSLRVMSSFLYGSDLYKKGNLGVFGTFGGDLSVPAPKEFLDQAPYPF